MRITISEIKQDKVYEVLLAEKPCIAEVTRKGFEDKVCCWALAYFDNVQSVFSAVESDRYSMVVVLGSDVYNDCDELQMEIDI